MEVKAFQKYSAYKDSGVEWLGEIPAEWYAVKMKYLFRDISEKNKPNETLLSVTQDKGVIPRDWVENRMVMPSGSLETFKFIEKGDFAISLRSFEGGLEYCYHDGIISPAYTVLKKDKSLHADFYKYLFKSTAFISEMQTSIVGIRQGKNISYPELSYSLLPIPPLPEQTAIAHFLDTKTAQIDRAIAQKEKLIALLKERKQIVIQQAVTGKVSNYDLTDDSENYDSKEKNQSPSQHQKNHSSRPMRDSGVEWIGEIPEHWEVKKMSFLTTKIGDGLHGTPEYTDNTDYFFINGNNLSKGYIEITEQTKTVNERQYLIHKKPLSSQTLLLSINGTIGNVAFYNNEKVMLGKSAAYLNFIEGVNLSFIRHFLISDIFKNYYELELSGSTINNLSLFSVGKIPVLYPPQDEQTAIVTYIETQSAKIDKAITVQEQQIEKLKEYKAVLVDSAVTGKIKVY